ncbi:pullulanase X25 domain-containing protein [Pseudarthrobacter cellobiosi]|uniref:pullulanase X25 domain-containing protein n=1 Tax=Pseudarthrobacter cellobiosi TaxID=2953654 RepID=UPI00208EFA38|nr:MULTISPECIES: glycosidase [unclassified Pseudarthrobacter]MCO4253964.1 glycosidase [Pseudarthrobacter sp. HLT1-5]MCO4273121.1 glycosidase [Pseudarthrobacter sp. HLT3-5]
MAKSIADNTDLRLKTVLHVLTEGVWSGGSLNAGEVLAEATARVPFSDHEATLLSGGIPRGHKTLTSATAKLVKAGWLVKGRSGWTITDDGMRATVAFPDADSFATALDAGTPVPADVAIPPAPAPAPAVKAAPAKKAPAKRTPAKKAADAVGKAAKAIEDAVEPVVKAVRSRKAAPKTATKATAEAHAVETFPQPEAVAVAGDFNTILGAPENWAPQYDEAQLTLDALDQLWKISADLPAGSYTFKIALNRSWDENYGAFGTFDGPNHELHHDGGTVIIRYDHRTRDITIN